MIAPICYAQTKHECAFTNIVLELHTSLQNDELLDLQPTLAMVSETGEQYNLPRLFSR